MKVFAVSSVRMDPHGEVMGMGATVGLFSSRISATAKIKALREKHQRDFGRGRSMPKWVIRTMKVED